MVHERCSSAHKYTHWQVMSIWLIVLMRCYFQCFLQECRVGIKLYLNRDSIPGIFLRVFQNFSGDLLWRTLSYDWLSSCWNPQWPTQIFDFHIYSNCWITPILLRVVCFNNRLAVIGIFLLVFRKPEDLKIGVWLSAQCFDILYSRG